jgi:hypothetical protein
VVGVEPQQRQEQSSRNSKQRRFVCSQEVPLVTAAEAALVNWRSLIHRNHQEPSCSCSIYSFAAAVPASITLALAPPHYIIGSGIIYFAFVCGRRRIGHSKQQRQHRFLPFSTLISLQAPGVEQQH